MMRSLRTQLSLTIMVVVLFTVMIVSVLSNQILSKEFEKYIMEQQTQKANNIVSNFSSQYNASTGEWNREFVHGVGMYALNDGYIVKVYDTKGDTVWDAQIHDMLLCMNVMAEITDRMEKSGRNSSGKFIVHDYDITQNGQKIGTVEINYYGPYFLSESEFGFLKAINAVLLFSGALSLIAALVMGYVLARRITRPIIKTSSIAKQIAEGNYEIRFEGKTKISEIDDLITVVNNLASALSEQEALRKQLTTDVAHELRTPLATVSAHLEAMIEGIWKPTPERLRSCYEETERLTELVADLQKLAYIESDNISLKKSFVNLLDIVHAVTDNFEIEINKKKLTLDVNGDSVRIFADKSRIAQVVTNLISNAIKYTHESGKIKVVVDDTEKDVILIIEDTGIGIPEDELPFIFERFYRTDKSRNRKTGGVGIGLTIAKSIVINHGGTIRAESLGEQGSKFTVVLPRDKEIQTSHD